MTANTLAALERAKAVYGGQSGAIKLALLRHFERRKLGTARMVMRLHEVLCFLRAYPDDEQLLAQVERMLGTFHRRADARQHRASLADTGIAGAPIHYRFFWPSAVWLARRWPREFQLDRSDREPSERISRALPLLVTPLEAAWLTERRLPAYQALDALRARDETDAVFLVRRVMALPGNARTREVFYDAMDAACVLKPGQGTPCRTHAKHSGAGVWYQKSPLRRMRPDLREQIAIPPGKVREQSRREGERLLDLGHAVLVTRARDLDAFAYGDPRDVRLIDDRNGLSFMLNGVVPERRPLVSALYGYLVLQSGVPIGYGDLIFAGRSVAVAFNTFETFRGGEAAWTFARVLAMARQLFGAQSFALDPYQLGHHNEEGIASGAWWFYYKLGFRPQAAEAKLILRKELALMKTHPGHRSERPVLRKLASSHLFFDVGSKHEGKLSSVAEVGERVARHLAQRAGSNRERGVRECAKEAMRLLGLRSLKGLTTQERIAWSRWAPLVTSFTGLGSWNSAEKRALVDIIKAKGGRRDSDFVELFARHPRLGDASFGPA